MELNLTDDANCSIRVILWGDHAESFEAPRNSIVAFKTMRVRDFGGEDDWLECPNLADLSRHFAFHDDLNADRGRTFDGGMRKAPTVA